MRVFPIENKDISGAAFLVRDLRTEMNGKKVCSHQEVEAVLFRAMEESSYAGFVVYDGEDRLVGYLGMNRRFALYANGLFFQITELFVLPDMRGKGVGRALVDHVEKMAYGMGGAHIELGAPGEKTHPGTHSFYKALGYRIVGPRLSKTLSAM